MNGLNIQIPWSTLLINGTKSVETRSYRLPKKYEGVPLKLIETSGGRGRFKSRIIGEITFSHCFKYVTKKQWISDYNRHKVNEDEENFGWNLLVPKYGWVVSNIVKYEHPIEVKKKKGIVFTVDV